jgi:malate dehydrogenase (oxaloacetate-decarboxylating)(NADP+)
MLYASATACAASLSAEEKAEGRTFPKIHRIREVSHAVACAVVEIAVAENQAPRIKKRDLKDGIAAFVGSKMYYPTYVPLIKR